MGAFHRKRTAFLHACKMLAVVVLTLVICISRADGSPLGDALARTGVGVPEGPRGGGGFTKRSEVAGASLPDSEGPPSDPELEFRFLQFPSLAPATSGDKKLPRAPKPKGAPAGDKKPLVKPTNPLPTPSGSKSFPGGKLMKPTKPLPTVPSGSKSLSGGKLVKPTKPLRSSESKSSTGGRKPTKPLPTPSGSKSLPGGKKPHVKPTKPLRSSEFQSSTGGTKPLPTPAGTKIGTDDEKRIKRGSRPPIGAVGGGEAQGEKPAVGRRNEGDRDGSKDRGVPTVGSTRLIGQTGDGGERIVGSRRSSSDEESSSENFDPLPNWPELSSTSSPTEHNIPCPGDAFVVDGMCYTAPHKWCPPSFVLNEPNDICVHKVPGRMIKGCPDGSNITPSGMCRRTFPETAVPRCPSSSPESCLWEQKSKRLATKAKMKCPDGWTIEGDQCSLVVNENPMPMCPDGFVLQEVLGGQEGLRLGGGRGEGRDHNLKRKSSDKDFACVKEIVTEASCGSSDGFVPEGDRCVSETRMPSHESCPRGFTLSSSGECFKRSLSKAEKVCDTEAGYQLQGLRCVLAMDVTKRDTRSLSCRHSPKGSTSVHVLSATTVQDGALDPLLPDGSRADPSTDTKKALKGSDLPTSGGSWSSGHWGTGTHGGRRLRKEKPKQIGISTKKNATPTKPCPLELVQTPIERCAAGTPHPTKPGRCLVVTKEVPIVTCPEEFTLQTAATATSLGPERVCLKRTQSVVPPTCPDGYARTPDNACRKREIASPELQCPEGSILQGLSCHQLKIAKASYDCPAGSKRSFVGGDLLCLHPVVFDPSATNQCPDGAIENPLSPGRCMLYSDLIQEEKCVPAPPPPPNGEGGRGVGSSRSSRGRAGASEVADDCLVDLTVIPSIQCPTKPTGGAPWDLLGDYCVAPLQTSNL